METDPDIIIGYNICNFDLPYLLNRAEALKLRDFPYWGRMRNKCAFLSQAPACMHMSAWSRLHAYYAAATRQYVPATACRHDATYTHTWHVPFESDKRGVHLPDLTCACDAILHLQAAADA